MAPKEKPVHRIVRAPTAEDLRPTPEQQRDFASLRQWEQDSAANTGFIVGVPANEQNRQRFTLTPSQRAYFKRIERWEEQPKSTLPFTE